MATPTPNGPTINDLQYQSFAISGAPYGFNPAVSETSITSENVVLNFVGYTATDLEEEFVTTSENIVVSIQLPGPNQFSIVTSDTTVTSEYQDESKQPGGVRIVSTSDTTVTSENVAAAEA